MPIKLLTLNIQGSLHLDRVHAALKLHHPDVACLQEVLEEDCAYLCTAGDYRCIHVTSLLFPQTGKSKPMGGWGVAILIRLPVEESTAICYSGTPELRVFQEPNDARRMLVMVRLQVEGRDYRIFTTHFTWSPAGQATALQHEDFSRLSAELSHYPEYVLCGDFNAPRGRSLFSRFLGDLPLIDNLPGSVTSTIDARYHRNPELQLVVDTIFSTSGYSVSNVEVLEGLSDHKAIIAVVQAFAPRAVTTPETARA